jgi:hypothetical protein
VLIPGSLVNPENGAGAIESSGATRPQAIEGAGRGPEATPGPEAARGSDSAPSASLRPTSGPPSSGIAGDPAAELDPELASALDAALDSGGALTMDSGADYDPVTTSGPGSNGFGSRIGHTTGDFGSMEDMPDPEPVAAAPHSSFEERATPSPEPEVHTTETGLPRRVRQASLANELRETVEPAEKPKKSLAAGRTPEQIRAMMSSFPARVDPGSLHAAAR